MRNATMPVRSDITSVTDFTRVSRPVAPASPVEDQGLGDIREVHLLLEAFQSTVRGSRICISVRRLKWGAVSHRFHCEPKKPGISGGWTSEIGVWPDVTTVSYVGEICP